MPDLKEGSYVSRGGIKLAAALELFQIRPSGLTCADFGSNVGGFVDCLLQHGAIQVYAIDTGYGVLAWPLRKDERVKVIERTNAMHLTLPEPVDLVTIDVAWTRQHHILPNAMRQLKTGGRIITLIKPQYEIDPKNLRKGALDPQIARRSLVTIRERIADLGLTILKIGESPIAGQSGNLEFLGCLTRTGE